MSENNVNDLKEPISELNESEEINKNLDEDIEEKTKLKTKDEDTSIKDSELVVNDDTGLVVTTNNLYKWYNKWKKNIPMIRNVRLDNITGIDSSEFLLLSYKSSSFEDKRELFLFKNPVGFPVINYKPESMNVYRNGVKIRYIYEYENDEHCIMYCYSSKASMYVIFTEFIDGYDYPYHIEKIKRSANVVNIPNCPTFPEDFGEISFEGSLKEIVLSCYPKVKSDIGKFEKVKDVANYFSELSDNTIDLNNLVKIEEVMKNLALSALAL